MLPMPTTSPPTRARWTGCLVAAALALAACEAGTGDPVAPYEDALPLDATLELLLPGDETLDGLSAQADGSVGTQTGALSDLPSVYQRAAVKRARIISAYLKSIRVRVAALVAGSDFEFHGEDRAVWAGTGPGGKVHALAIERLADGHFVYQVLVRPDDAQPLEWAVIIAGSWTPAGGKDGSGAIWIDLARDHKVQSDGTVLALWSRQGGHIEITAHLYEATDDGAGEAGAEPRTEVYLFQKKPGGGGLFVFPATMLELVQGDGLQPTPARVVARWVASGAGRADVVLPDFPADTGGVQLRSHCWAPEAEGYELVYSDGYQKLPDQPGLIPLDPMIEGDPADCVFPERAQAVLPPQGQPPETPQPFGWFVEGAAKVANGQ